MRINANAQAVVVGKNERFGKDGKTKYHDLAIVVDGQAGNMPCSEDVFNMVEPMKQYNLGFSYNSEYQYNPMRVYAVIK